MSVRTYVASSTGFMVVGLPKRCILQMIGFKNQFVQTHILPPQAQMSFWMDVNPCTHVAAIPSCLREPSLHPQRVDVSNHMVPAIMCAVRLGTITQSASRQVEELDASILFLQDVRAYVALVVRAEGA